MKNNRDRPFSFRYKPLLMGKEEVNKERKGERKEREEVTTILRRLLGCNPRHIDLHSHLLLISEHLHISGFL